MNNSELYNYNLTVYGRPEDLEKVHALLSESMDHEKKLLGDSGYLVLEEQTEEWFYYETPDDAQYGDGTAHTSEWEETSMENTLHDIALQVPDATVYVHAMNYDETYGFNKRFMGDLFQEQRFESRIPDFEAGADVPFAERYAVHHTALSEPTEAPKKMYILCEEYEDDDGIRSFTIKGLSPDEDFLKEEMQRLIREDPYEAISEKGVDQDELRPTHFITNVSDGYLEYYILEEPVIERSKNRSLASSNEKPKLSDLLKDAQSRIAASEQPQTQVRFQPDHPEQGRGE